MASFQQYLPAAGIILLPNLGGILSGFISNDSVNGWYRTLKRPALAPPNWVFGPVWTSIYACMGVSSYLIFKQGGFAAQALPLSVFGAQLFFNWIWSPLFFKLQRMDLVNTIVHEYRLVVHVRTRIVVQRISFYNILFPTNFL